MICIRRASEEFGPLSDLVIDFTTSSLSLKSTVPALELYDNGDLRGGDIDGVDCLKAQVSMRGNLPAVAVGPDSVPTLSFTNGSEGRPKAVQGRLFSLTYYLPWMAEKSGLSEDDRFSTGFVIVNPP